MADQNPVQKLAADMHTRIFVLEALVMALTNELASTEAVKRVEAVVNLAIDSTAWSGPDSVAKGLDAKDQAARLFELIQSLPKSK